MNKKISESFIMQSIGMTLMLFYGLPFRVSYTNILWIIFGVGDIEQFWNLRSNLPIAHIVLLNIMLYVDTSLCLKM